MKISKSPPIVRAENTKKGNVYKFQGKITSCSFNDMKPHYYMLLGKIGKDFDHYDGLYSFLRLDDGEIYRFRKFDEFEKVDVELIIKPGKLEDCELAKDEKRNWWETEFARIARRV